MKYFYGFLCILGIALPYSQFVPWLTAHGLDIPLFIQAATRSRISAFAWADVLVSAIALLGFILHDGRRSGIKWLGLPMLGTLTVGVSLGLPLFLLLRAWQQERQAPTEAIAE